MNICIATDSFLPHNSGIATHNYYLSRLLQESGNNIVVLTADFENRKDADTITEEAGITVVRLRKSYGDQYNYFNRFIRSGNREAVAWLSFGMALRNWLISNQQTYNFDIIEASDYGGFGIFLVDEKLPALVIMCHGLLTQLNKREFYNQDENLSVIRFLEANTIQHADAVICHSQSNATEISGLFKVSAFYVTAPWINDTFVESKETRNTFIIASRLQVCKGALVMAGVMNSLRDDYPGINLVWIGDDTYTAPGGWMVSKYIRKNFPAVWQKTFTWKKAIPRKNMMEELDASKVLVIPSVWETFNYVALEAANRKKALIITKQAGISSVLDHPGIVLMTDALVENSIREAMINLHNNQGLQKELGENLFEAVSRTFSKENFLKDRQEAWSVAIQKRKNRPPVNPLQAFFTS